MSNFKEMVKERIIEFYNSLNDFMDWVGEYEDVELPADKSAEMIPTYDEKEEIYKAIYSGRQFNVEILYGDLLREAFNYERSFRYGGKYVIEPVHCGNFWKSGFDVVENGETILNYEFDGYYESDYQKLLKPFNWEAMAADIMDDLSDREED